MTIDEAISHAMEVAEQEEKNSKTGQWFEGEDWNVKAREQCAECAAEHRQLAEWLTELKQWRRVYGVCPSYEMCIPECKEGYNAQIAEYKRLLQLAWDDIQTLNDATVDDEGNCLIEDKFESYTECPLYCGSGEFCGWRYQVDALMLLGDTNDEP